MNQINRREAKYGICSFRPREGCEMNHRGQMQQACYDSFRPREGCEMNRYRIYIIDMTDIPVSVPVRGVR